MVSLRIFRLYLRNINTCLVGLCWFLLSLEEESVVWKTYLPCVQGGWWRFPWQPVICQQVGLQTSVSPDYIPVFVKAGTVSAFVIQDMQKMCRKPWGQIWRYVCLCRNRREPYQLCVRMKAYRLQLWKKGGCSSYLSCFGWCVFHFDWLSSNGGQVRGWNRCGTFKIVKIALSLRWKIERNR